MQNNPVNYTDPSGHFWNSIKKGWNYVKSGLNWAGRQISRGVNWVGRQWNKVQTAYNSASDYIQQKYQQAAAQIEARRQQVVQSAYALATGRSSSPTIREGKNLYRNWNTALENTLKHVCDPKTTKGQDDASKKKLTASE